jgi:hypothetical protein
MNEFLNLSWGARIALAITLGYKLPPSWARRSDWERNELVCRFLEDRAIASSCKRAA